MKHHVKPMRLKENNYNTAHPFEDTSSSETENEYTGSEDEVSDLENNPTDTAFSSNGRFNASNNKQGVSPPCSKKLV